MKIEWALYMLLVLTLTGAIGAQDECVDCPDPTRPWMRGAVEVSCANPNAVEHIRKENPDATVKPCTCQHVCDPFDDRAGETKNRHWDHHCEARCKTSGCACPDPCDS